MLAHVGAANLARVTFMTRTDARAGQWEFGGRAVKAYPDTGFGEPGPLEITAIGSELQTVNQDGVLDFAFIVEPAFAEDVGLPAASAADLAGLPPASQADVHDWAMRIERPTNTTPDSTDCASCHIAPHARAALEGLDPTLLSTAEAAELAPRTSGSEDGNIDNLRAFGWFGAEPVISQRAANESAHALAGIASTYPL